MTAMAAESSLAETSSPGGGSLKYDLSCNKALSVTGPAPQCRTSSDNTGNAEYLTDISGSLANVTAAGATRCASSPCSLDAAKSAITAAKRAEADLLTDGSLPCATPTKIKEIER